MLRGFNIFNDCDYVVNTIGRSGSKMLIRCLQKHSVKVLSDRKPTEAMNLNNPFPARGKGVLPIMQM
jgi:hypothetical protein